MTKYIYFIALKERCKFESKQEFYKCEICGMLETTENLHNAFLTESEDFAHELAEHIDYSFDYKATVLQFTKT